jgi:hypothetical protein
MRYEHHPAGSLDDGAPVVTYSRMMPTGRRPRTLADGVAPRFHADDVPFVDGRDASVIPDVRAVGAVRSPRGAPPVADPLGEERRPRLVRIVVFLGALAIVGGVAVLAVAYNQAINAPIDRAASATPAAAGAPANGPVETSAPSASSNRAVREVTLAPAAAQPAPEPRPQATMTAAAPAADEPSAPTTAPTPHPRPQGTATTQEAQTGGQPASAPSDMDQLMDRVGQILATIPPEEDAAAASAPPELPTLPGASAAAPSAADQPGALAPLAPSGALSPVTTSGEATAAPSASANAPTPPAAIPDAAPLSVLR